MTELDLFKFRNELVEVSPGVFEHEIYDMASWRYDVANGDTLLGYWNWVNHNVESNEEEEN